MKKIIALLLIMALTVTLFTGCSKKADWDVPEKIITTEEYHAAIDALLDVENCTEVTAEYSQKVDEIDKQLTEQIHYNTDDLKDCKGTVYYVAQDGNDDNDGKSPKTAWASLDKVSIYQDFKEGDYVLFNRGDVFRGSLCPKSGVSYGAYGEGPKPELRASMDGKADCTWEKTETENVWKRTPNEKVIQPDMGFILLKTKDGEEICCSQVTKMSGLKKNYQFLFAGSTLREGKRDFCEYLYYDGGNPADVFEEIDLPTNTSVIDEGNIYLENVTINNLALLYGRGPFWPGDNKNIKVSYCECKWSGGFADGANGVRYGGGGGCWGSCDSFIWDHCLIYQQWDSGLSPQFKGPHDGVVKFIDFQATNCIFKGCKWPLEYWLDQGSTDEDTIEGMKFNYNLVRDGDKAFNKNRTDIAYVQSWNYQNTCIDCEINHNLFEKAPGLTYSIAGRKMVNGKGVLSYDFIPKLENNIYIQRQRKKFAIVNGKSYRYVDEDIKKYIEEGFDKGSVYLYAPEEKDSEEE